MTTLPASVRKAQADVLREMADFLLTAAIMDAGFDSDAVRSERNWVIELLTKRAAAIERGEAK